MAFAVRSVTRSSIFTSDGEPAGRRAPRGQTEPQVSLVADARLAA